MSGTAILVTALAGWLVLVMGGTFVAFCLMAAFDRLTTRKLERTAEVVALDSFRRRPYGSDAA